MVSQEIDTVLLNRHYPLQILFLETIQCYYFPADTRTWGCLSSHLQPPNFLETKLYILRLNFVYPGNSCASLLALPSQYLSPRRKRNRTIIFSAETPQICLYHQFPPMLKEWVVGDLILVIIKCSCAGQRILF